MQLIQQNFARIYESIDRMCSIYEESSSYDYQTVQEYQQLRKRLIEDVKALEFFVLGSLKSKRKGD